MNSNDNDTNKQKGFIKEIVIVVIVIFILAYFNLDATLIWEKIMDIWKTFLDSLNQFRTQ